MTACSQICQISLLQKNPIKTENAKQLRLLNNICQEFPLKVGKNSERNTKKFAADFSKSRFITSI